MRWTTTGARVRCRVASGGGGGMQGGADAQLSRRSMQLHANPSNGRRLHSLPLYFSLSRISLSLSFFIPLCTLLFSSSCSFLASLPTFGCFSLSLFLALSLFLLPRVLTRLVTPPFSLHPRSMTSVRGNAPQRRLLSLSQSLPVSPVHAISHFPFPSRTPLYPLRALPHRRCSLFTSVRDF